MPAPAYSTRLFAGSLAASGTFTDLFTVPMGYRVVIHQVNLLQAYATTNALIFIIRNSAEVLRVLPDATTLGSYDGRVVFHEGETCSARAANATAYFYVGGYLLQGAGGPLVPGVLPVGA